MAIVAVVAIGGCSAAPSRSVSEIQPSAAPRERAVMPPRPIVLAEGDLPALPSDSVEWVAERVSFYDRPIAHRHAAAFVYADVTPSRVVLPSGARTLMPGQAVFVPAGVWHTHERTCGIPTDCHDSFMEIRMAGPDAKLPAGDMPAARAFDSPEIPVTPGAPAHVRLELIDPDSVSAAAHDGGVVYIRIPRDGYALGWRVVQEGLGPRR